MTVPTTEPVAPPVTPVAATPDAPTAPPAEPTPANGGPIQLPADHPLVRTLDAQKATIAELKKFKDDTEDASRTQAEKDAKTLADQAAELAATQRKLALATAGVAEADWPLFEGVSTDNIPVLAERLKATAAVIPTTDAPPPMAGVQGNNGTVIGGGKPPTLAEQIVAASQEAAAAEPGSAARRQAASKVMALKAQQIAEVAKGSK